MQETKHDTESKMGEVDPHDAPGPIPSAATQPSDSGNEAAQGVATDSRDVATSERVNRSSARWWLAIGVGAIVSLPLAWLLSFAVALPFFIGVFFFALFGLVIGAAVYRLAASHRPYSSAAVLTGTTVLVALVWIVSMDLEARGFPQDVATKAIRATRDLRGMAPEQFREAVAAEVRAFMSNQYPPGGTIGYARWALTSGSLAKEDLSYINRAMRFAQMRGWWAVRVVLSIALLAFGIASQTWALKPTPGSNAPA